MKTAPSHASHQADLATAVVLEAAAKVGQQRMCHWWTLQEEEGSWWGQQGVTPQWWYNAAHHQPLHPATTALLQICRDCMRPASSPRGLWPCLPQCTDTQTDWLTDYSKACTASGGTQMLLHAHSLTHSRAVFYLDHTMLTGDRDLVVCALPNKPCRQTPWCVCVCILVIDLHCCRRNLLHKGCDKVRNKDVQVTIATKIMLLINLST